MVLLILFYIFRDQSLDVIFAYFEWVEDHPVEGISIYTGVFIIWVTLALPGFILTFAGAIIFTNAFGFWTGYFIILFITIFSHVVAGFFSFLIGRYLIYDCIRLLIYIYIINRPAFAKYKKLQAFDEALKVEGFKVLFLLRINPITSYPLGNLYLLLLSCWEPRRSS